MARVPMRVVYWGRWADATGNVGPFSETVVGWVEGGAHLPALAPSLHHTKQLKLLEDVGPRALPEGPESVYVVAVMQAQYESLMRALPALPESGEGVATSTAALPAPAREVLQIEGPREDAAEERVAA